MAIRLKAELWCDDCHEAAVDVLATVELSSDGVEVHCDTPHGWACRFESGYGRGRSGYEYTCPKCKDKHDTQSK
jgi:hypothetical protein